MPLPPDQRPDEHGNLIPVGEAALRYGPTAFYPSEAAKYLCLTRKYLHGNGVDLASGGWPVVEHAIQVELPSQEFNSYTGGRRPEVPIQWHGDLRELPFKDGTLDWVHCSHGAEDFSREEWPHMFKEWSRVLKPTGHLIVLVPERSLWQHCVQVLGQTPNCAHHGPEPLLGDMSRTALLIGMRVVEERLTSLYPDDYTILGVFSR